LHSNKSIDFKFNKGLHNPSLIKINSGNEFIVSSKPSVFEYTNVYEIAEKTAEQVVMFSIVEVKVLGETLILHKPLL
jgi:hypothetical protein